MALHSKKDFASMCGLTTGNLSVYKDRGKVVYSGDYIDDSIEPNKSFLQKRTDKVAKAPIVAKAPAKATKIHPKRPPSAPAKPVNRAIDPPNVAAPTQKGELYELGAQKIRLQNEKLKHESELLERKKMKLEGESLPYEHVKTLIIIQTESSKLAWEHATEDLIVELTSKLQLSREIVAEIRSKINGIANTGTVRAAAETKKALRRLQDEISAKKERGEHD